jgi:hypothetical protein
MRRSAKLCHQGRGPVDEAPRAELEAAGQGLESTDEARPCRLSNRVEMPFSVRQIGKTVSYSLVSHPLLLVAMELDRAQHRAPLAELVHPVVQRGLRHDDHVRALDAAELVQVAQQRDRLQRLAQALRRTRAPQRGSAIRADPSGRQRLGVAGPEAKRPAAGDSWRRLGRPAAHRTRPPGRKDRQTPWKAARALAMRCPGPRQRERVGERTQAHRVVMQGRNAGS